MEANIPAHMKGAAYRKADAGKILEIRDLDQPHPKENEALLRVRAASVNPLDWRMKSERPGVDVAGEIIAVGKKVTQFKPGDAVFGVSKGAFAEYACARECKLAQKPESVSFEQAAAVPIAGITALQALRDAAHLQAGQKVLINGAAGGVGTFAVQIAKSFGAQVTGVCSTKNVELVRSLGADRVIDYTCEDFSEDSERYDLLLDNVGNRKLSAMKGGLRLSASGRPESANAQWGLSAPLANCPTQAKRRLEWATGLFSLILELDTGKVSPATIVGNSCLRAGLPYLWPVSVESLL